MKKIDIPKSLIEETVIRLRTAILDGELRLGSKLSEQKLADILGVSRSPVSQALAILRTEGLVEIFPKRGTFVYSPDARDVSELCEYRAVLETAAMTMAMQREPKALVAEMSKAMQGMEEALSKTDESAYSRYDRDFHVAIMNNCGNSRLKAAYLRAISSILAIRNHVMISAMSAHAARSMVEHRLMFAACKAGDAEKACSLLRTHIQHLDEDFVISSGARAAEMQI